MTTYFASKSSEKWNEWIDSKGKKVQCINCRMLLQPSCHFSTIFSDFLQTDFVQLVKNEEKLFWAKLWAMNRFLQLFGHLLHYQLGIIRLQKMEKPTRYWLQLICSDIAYPTHPITHSHPCNVLTSTKKMQGIIWILMVSHWTMIRHPICLVNFLIYFRPKGSPYIWYVSRRIGYCQNLCLQHYNNSTSRNPFIAIEKKNHFWSLFACRCTYAHLRASTHSHIRGYWSTNSVRKPKTRCVYYISIFFLFPYLNCYLELFFSHCYYLLPLNLLPLIYLIYFVYMYFCMFVVLVALFFRIFLLLLFFVFSLLRLISFLFIHRSLRSISTISN